MNNIAVIIPALDHNVYHDQGDLAPFGDVSLLEWKLAQVGRVVSNKQIYISSPSDTILDFAKEKKLNAIKRRIDLSLSEMISLSISNVIEETILWANVTSPFVSSHDYESFISIFKGLTASNDSFLTTLPIREYVLYKRLPLNFELHQHVSRRSIDPIQIITNGCFIIKKKLALTLGSYIGNRPFLHEVDRLTAVEIKDITDLNIANDLLTLYMRNKEL